MAAGVLLAGMAPAAADTLASITHSCRLPGVEHEARCGELTRPLDLSQPGGTTIQLHFAVLPALARNHKPDPVFFIAGGPGQSAIELAGPIGRLLGRMGTRRDIVLVDQRGTGRSAPLLCEAQAPTAPLAQQLDPALQVLRIARCRQALVQLAHGDLRHYGTAIASADLDAVRQVLKVEQINLVGVSYGTRVALDYMRQFPASVRRSVLDGVTPPDMVLPQAAAIDTQAAFDALLEACAADSACEQRYSGLRNDWQALLGSLPRTVRLTHPVSGTVETIQLTRAMLLGMVRGPLYSPVLASALPAALHAAARGNFTPLVGLS
ncbi:MAG: alpha/beta fold hydrolase, partial [Rubrivivax sp.]